MKKYYVIRWICILFFACMLTGLFGQVKIGGLPGPPHSSAVLQLDSAHLGLLITQVSLTGATDNTTIPGPANSLLVYNTAVAGTGGDAVSPGYYYWDNASSRWKGLMTSAGPAGDVWIDLRENILSNNSGNQVLTGTRNVVLGEEAFEDWDLATNNYIAIGYQAGKEDTTDGDANVIAVGALAAFSNAGANLNSLGWQAAYSNIGQYVNALGREAAKNNMGDHAVAIGDSTLIGDTLAVEGAGNIGIGFKAGYNVGAGYRNICIGYRAYIDDPGASDQINIGNSIIRTFDGVIHMKDMIQLNPRSDLPGSPDRGTMYYDDDEDIIYAWDGTAWQALW